MQRIFVGDVQGCADELEALLGRAERTFGDAFELWLAGDLVNRGPDNRRPLERVRALVEAGRAEYILGNHEISLLAASQGLREPEPEDTFQDVLDAPDAGEWIDWLRRRPLVVPGELDGQRFAMVHAAAGPDWSRDELVATGEAVSARLSAPLDALAEFLAADPARDPLRDALGRMTRCRSVTPDGGWSSGEPDAASEPWHRAWARRGHDYALVYGHWARQGLHVANGLRGLDTGCVHHGRWRDGFLTAWLPASGPAPSGGRPFDAPDDRFWQEPARGVYWRGHAAAPAPAGGA